MAQWDITFEAAWSAAMASTRSRNFLFESSTLPLSSALAMSTHSPVLSGFKFSPARYKVARIPVLEIGHLMCNVYQDPSLLLCVVYCLKDFYNLMPTLHYFTRHPFYKDATISSHRVAVLPHPHRSDSFLRMDFTWLASGVLSICCIIHPTSEFQLSHTSMPSVSKIETRVFPPLAASALRRACLSPDESFLNGSTTLLKPQSGYISIDVYDTRHQSACIFCMSRKLTYCDCPVLFRRLHQMPAIAESSAAQKANTGSLTSITWNQVTTSIRTNVSSGIMASTWRYNAQGVTASQNETVLASKISSYRFFYTSGAYMQLLVQRLFTDGGLALGHAQRNISQSHTPGQLDFDSNDANITLHNETARAIALKGNAMCRQEDDFNKTVTLPNLPAHQFVGINSGSVQFSQGSELARASPNDRESVCRAGGVCNRTHISSDDPTTHLDRISSIPPDIRHRAESASAAIGNKDRIYHTADDDNLCRTTNYPSHQHVGSRVNLIHCEQLVQPALTNEDVGYSAGGVHTRNDAPSRDLGHQSHSIDLNPADNSHGTELTLAPEDIREASHSGSGFFNIPSARSVQANLSLTNQSPARNPDSHPLQNVPISSHALHAGTSLAASASRAPHRPPVQRKIAGDSRSSDIASDVTPAESSHETSVALSSEPERGFRISSNLWRCLECGIEIKGRRANLNRHIHNRHDLVRNFECPKQECRKRFQSQVNLDRHMAGVHEGRPLKCGKCPRDFKGEDELAEHIRIAHRENGRTLACDKCGKCYGRRSSLRRHVKSHNREKTTMNRAPGSVHEPET